MLSSNWYPALTGNLAWRKDLGPALWIEKASFLIRLPLFMETFLLLDPMFICIFLRIMILIRIFRRTQKNGWRMLRTQCYFCFLAGPFLLSAQVIWIGLTLRSWKPMCGTGIGPASWIKIVVSDKYEDHRCKIIANNFWAYKLDMSSR